MSPVVPPSCKPWEGIEDEDERVEQIRNVADQFKAGLEQMAVIPIDFLSPDMRQHKEDMEKKVHDMETYIAELTGEQPPPISSGDQMDGDVGTKNESNSGTDETKATDDRKEFAGIPLPPAPKIDRDEAGNLVLPESLAGYEGLVNAGMDAGYIAASLKPMLDAYKNSLQGMSSLPHNNSILMDTAQKVVDFQAVIDAVSTQEERDEHKDTASTLKDYSQEIMKEIRNCEGDTMEEQIHRHTRKTYQKVMDGNPLAGRLEKNYIRIASLCMEYRPPKYQTSILHEDGVTPYLVYFINNYLDGLEGFAEDLASSIVQGHNTSKDCEAFRDILEEVSSPGFSGDTTWDEVKTAVFLVCATLGATSIRHHFQEEKYMNTMKFEDLDSHDADNFNFVKAIVTKKMKAITAQLKSIESDMRESGDLKKLAGLKFVSEGTGASIRQDTNDTLGKHPSFLQYSDFLKRLPCAYPGNPKGERTQHLYLTGDEIGHQFMTEVLDEDLRDKLVSDLELFKKAFSNKGLVIYQKQYDEIRIFERTTTQPFLFWLIHISRRVAPVFHDRMKDLLGAKYSGAPLKRIARASAKIKEDYSHLDREMPSAAHLLDVVRGLIVCSTAEEMCEMYETVCRNFEVLRVKNGFEPLTSKSGFRQILMNLRFDPGNNLFLPDGCAIICEIQLNLESYVHVKHQIHILYEIVRCKKHEEVSTILQESAQPF
jgi:hypothetical protein